MKGSKTFTPHLLFIIIIFLVSAGLLSYLFYSWLLYGGLFYLLISVFPLIGVVVFVRPLVFFPHVTIDNSKRITIRYWVGKGHTDNISTALYEIVVKNENIRSYRFIIQNKYFQVSPTTYIQGDELAEILKSYIKQKKLILNVVDL